MKLNRYELRSVLVIGTIIALRLLGIFLIIPVFSIYAVNYEGATLSSAGVAFGIYALTQSLLQIPFGMASDRFGRKPVIVLGLLIFCVGSVLCAFADSIWELIITRAIQGSGAIGAVAIAILGDCTRNEVRAQSFMLTGIIIGTAFIISLIVGPVLAGKFGFESLFFILAALGLIAVLVTLFMFPELPKKKTRDRKEILLKLREPEVGRILSSTFITSICLNLILFIYPLDWKNIGTGPQDLWFVYLVILAPSALLANAYIRISETRKKLKQATRFGLFFLVAAFLIYLLRASDSITLYLAGAVFFLGYSIFQSILPAFVTQRVSSENRGVLSGFFNLANFMGACVGGMSAGILYETHQSLPLIFGLLFLIMWNFVGLPGPPLEQAEEE
ncbi:MAG: MFS transporter [Candidatus Dadabacteria bacterium]|nr:MFS transporter [Candidatus Dadabacteria bacterium]MDE0291256.1 MFS transporter [Candidatus Dadabacteria bacterium]MDE0476666.1 MFS transporter [Candidatus Dadabacteria bacterium]